MRYLYAVAAALALALVVFSLLPDAERAGGIIHAEAPEAVRVVPAHDCSASCSLHSNSTSSRSASKLAIHGLIWEKSAAAPETVTITGAAPVAKNYQARTRQTMTLEDGTTVKIDVHERYVHTDGTVAVSGSVAGTPEGKIHLQWNQRDRFFLGQIEYPNHPVAYEIKRDDHGNYQIHRRSVTSLVCSEVNNGQVSYGMPGLPDSLNEESEGAGGGGSEGEGPGLVPALNSHPSATAVVYLDFDGEQVKGTPWGSNITADPTGYTASKITEIWARVASDMQPFNLNVTTEESVYLNAPAAHRIRCIITPSNEWYGSNTAGGVAKLGSFPWSGDTPCWVFSDNLANGSKYIAEACSHEVGHTFGLSHDGKSGTSYYAGHGSGAVGWAPIMGNGYFKNLTQWSKGEYSSATNTQDDLSIITSNSNGFGYRIDDHSNRNSGASALPADSSGAINGTGTIERSDDVDVFAITAGDGDLTISIDPATGYGNLDIHAELYDASGELIASANPSATLNAALTVAVSSGEYFLHIRSTGYGTADTGSSDYASLGSYQVSGQVPEISSPTPYQLSVASLPDDQQQTDDDPDGDGYDNLTEHALGTDPGTASSTTSFTSIDPGGPSGFDFLLDLPSDIPVDVIYTVQATCTLAVDDWIEIANLNSSGNWSGSAEVTEESPPSGKRRFRVSESTGGPWPCRFIRVRFSLATP